MYKSYLNKDSDKQPTPFQKKIWEALNVVPAGQLTTYARMCEATGHSPRAAQAAHNAVKAGLTQYNQDLPQHRIIRANGSMYLSGNHTADQSRIAVLRAEGIAVRDDARIPDIQKYLYDYRQ